MYLGLMLFLVNIMVVEMLKIISVMEVAAAIMHPSLLLLGKCHVHEIQSRYQYQHCQLVLRRS